MDRIVIEGIEFHGHHGVSRAERELGHRFRAELVLELDLRPAAHADEVNLTVDYAGAVREVLDVNDAESVHLVEALAERIAARLLGRYPQLQAVEVRLTKLLPPAPLPFQASRVEIRRTR